MTNFELLLIKKLKVIDGSELNDEKYKNRIPRPYSKSQYRLG